MSTPALDYIRCLALKGVDLLHDLFSQRLG